MNIAIVNIKDGIKVVGIIEGDIIAECLGYQFDDKTYIIERLFVLDIFRKRGFAKELLNRMEKELLDLGIEKISLICLPEDDSVPIEILRKFYWSMGYKNAGICEEKDQINYSSEMFKFLTTSY